MNHNEAAEQIARRPAVHRLCYGAFLQAPVWISPDVLAVPLAPLGFEAELGYVSAYLRQFSGIELTLEESKAGRAQGAEALPVITVSTSQRRAHRRRSSRPGPENTLNGPSRSSLGRPGTA